MLGGAKPPRPSDTPPILGGAKAALPLRDGYGEQPPYAACSVAKRVHTEGARPNL